MMLSAIALKSLCKKILLVKQVARPGISGIIADAGDLQRLVRRALQHGQSLQQILQLHHMQPTLSSFFAPAFRGLQYQYRTYRGFDKPRKVPETMRFLPNQSAVVEVWPIWTVTTVPAATCSPGAMD